MKSSFLTPPEFLSLPLFGIAISESSVKIVKMQKKNKGVIPVVFEEVSFPGVCNVLDESPDHESCGELKKTIINLKKKHNIVFAQLSIPEEHTYVFEVRVPREALLMVKDFIVSNIDQYIPLSASEVYFDHKILKAHIKEEIVPVIVTAIPKIIVEKYTNVVESCGILPVGCEPETHAIARCVIDKGDTNPYIIMYIDEYATKISIVEEGLVQYTHTVQVKSSDIQGQINPETTQLLKDTINKVIIYWFTSKDQHVRSSKIENVILTGVGVDSPDFINFFESNLAVNASHANVWKNCFDISEYIPKMSKVDSLKFAPCVGLSLFKLK